jgi:hypothetical protein
MKIEEHRIEAGTVETVNRVREIIDGDDITREPVVEWTALFDLRKSVADHFLIFKAVVYQQQVELLISHASVVPGRAKDSLKIAPGVL